VRGLDLEGVDSDMVVFNVIGDESIRIFNIYWCFKPQNVRSAREKFQYQLHLIKTVHTVKLFVIGDMNLDANKIDYPNKDLFNDFDQTGKSKYQYVKIYYLTTHNLLGMQ
jgi:hypothetical protein